MGQLDIGAMAIAISKLDIYFDTPISFYFKHA